MSNFEDLKSIENETSSFVINILEKNGVFKGDVGPIYDGVCDKIQELYCDNKPHKSFMYDMINLYLVDCHTLFRALYSDMKKGKYNSTDLDELVDVCKEDFDFEIIEDIFYKTEYENEALTYLESKGIIRNS